MQRHSIEPFTILMVDTVKITISPVFSTAGELVYDVSFGGRSYGSVFPYIDCERGLCWKTTDGIHPHFVEIIGAQIALHNI